MAKPTFADRVAFALLKTSIGKEIQESFAASAVTDTNFFPMGMSDRYQDRYKYDREKVLSECLRAWRVQPLARRIVKILTQFTIGMGVTINSSHKATYKFVYQWWHDEMNDFDNQVPEWMDEVTRAGELYFLWSVDIETGMSYVRALPADQIKDIQTKANDIRQETFFISTDLNISPYPAFNKDEQQKIFIVHYAVNRPVGCKFGEPDLAPLLPWIGRYAAWLEDRARLNRFRFAWLIVWKKKWTNDAEKKAKQNELNSNPPNPGSFLLLDPDETVEMPTPNLASGDASEDGLAMKKMIAGGIGLPLHYLAEPESSTRTTAEAAGTPTFRGLEQSQQSFLRMLTKLARIAVFLRKRATNTRLDPESVTVSGPDITERDNAILALAVARIYPVLSDLFDRKGIEEAELLRLIYRMAGELYDEEAKTPTMLRRPLKPSNSNSSSTPGPVTPSDSAKNPKTPDEQGPA